MAQRARPEASGGDRRLVPAPTAQNAAATFTNILSAMTKTELESKHIAELHALAAKAGVERYRMLPRAELIEKLADGGSGGGSGSARERRPESGRPRRGREERPRQERREEKPREGGRQRRQREEPRDSGRRQEPPSREPKPAPTTPSRSEPAAAESAAPAGRPKRKRRRRRWGRRRKGVRLHDLLLPAAAGRQAIVYAESRATCTALLREVAAELSGASSGPDPIALLIDPSPEELADWRRDVPQAEIVAAGKANHADDAIAQAIRRAEGGEAVIFLIDSLSRFAESYGDTNGARDFLDTALTASKSATGSLTVVAAVERPS
jgi:transcription termination factor Rho